MPRLVFASSERRSVMETDRFDRGTRLVASVFSRRTLASVLGLGALARPDLTEAKKKRKKKKCKACTSCQLCKKGKCRPKAEGSTCDEGRVCAQGVCACPPGQKDSGGVCATPPTCLTPLDDTCTPADDCCSGTCSGSVCFFSDQGQRCHQSFDCHPPLICQGFICNVP
jgi:hypothetical protein